MKKILITLLALISIIPVFSHAQQVGPTTLNYSGLVQCDGVVLRDKQGNPLEQDRDKECSFAELVSMANYIIRWIFTLTIPIFIIIMAYAGFLYMMPPSSGKRQQANKMLWQALIGFVIMLCAWFIVSTLLKWLIDPSFKGADALIEQQK